MTSLDHATIQDRLEGFRRNKTQMRLTNRYLRHGNDAGLLSLGYTREQIASLRVPDSTGCIGYPPALIRNVGARIYELNKQLKGTR